MNLFGRLCRIHKTDLCAFMENTEWICELLAKYTEWGKSLNRLSLYIFVEYAVQVFAPSPNTRTETVPIDSLRKQKCESSLNMENYLKFEYISKFEIKIELH